MILAMIIRINQHVKGIIVVVELVAIVSQGTPCLQGTIVGTCLEILTAIFTRCNTIVSFRQMIGNVFAGLFNGNIIQINLIIIICHVFLSQFFPLALSYQITGNNIIFLAQLDGIDANQCLVVVWIIVGIGQ